MAEEKNLAEERDMNEGSPKPELIVVTETAHVTQTDQAEVEQERRNAIEEPAKVMRIGTMIKQLLDEVRQAPLDEKSRARLREIYDTSVRELADGLSPDLREELDRLTSPFDGDDVPSESELRVAQAQLVGWLEGLFHGIQAALFAQQSAARAQLEEIRRRGLPPGGTDDGDGDADATRPGNYL